MATQEVCQGIGCLSHRMPGWTKKDRRAEQRGTHQKEKNERTYNLPIQAIKGLEPKVAGTAQLETLPYMYSV